ncbi:hypothetical protein SCA6_018247 [Theobroma cacao]
MEKPYSVLIYTIPEEHNITALVSRCVLHHIPQPPQPPPPQPPPPPPPPPQPPQLPPPPLLLGFAPGSSAQENMSIDIIDRETAITQSKSRPPEVCSGKPASS